MTSFHQGECSSQLVQHKKMTFEQASGCIQRGDREWKYQKMSIVNGLARRFSRVQSSSQEQWSLGNYYSGLGVDLGHDSEENCSVWMSF